MKRMLMLLAIACAQASALAQITQRVGLAPGGAEPDGRSAAPTLSESGRYVVFSSLASNLVPADTNGDWDTFVFDRVTRETTRISTSSSGAQATGGSYSGVLSADERCIAFTSVASDLVAGDANGMQDVFVHDRLTKQTTRVSVDSTGLESDGRSTAPSISADGRYVAFESVATNLVAGDTNATDDVFVHDRQTGQTTRVSVSSTGVQGNKYSRMPFMSSDGRFVAFWSMSTNLAPPDLNLWNGDVFLHDRATGQTRVVSVDSAGQQDVGEAFVHGLSADGRLVLFSSDADELVPGDTNGKDDLFVFDALLGQTTRVSVASGGAQVAEGISGGAALSPDGRYVVFGSWSPTIVPGDTNAVTDLFLHDRSVMVTERVTVDSTGDQGNAHTDAGACSVASAGPSIVFASESTDLVVGDANGLEDVFLRALDCPTALAYCVAKVNSLGCSPAIELLGSASASAGSGATLRTTLVIGQKHGIFFHSSQGPASVPFHGGALCVQGPPKRHALLHSGGTGATCTGVFQEDLNAYIASGADPAIVAGVSLYVQTWSRDSADAFGDSLSNALRVDVCQ